MYLQKNNLTKTHNIIQNIMKLEKKIILLQKKKTIQTKVMCIMMEKYIHKLTYN